MMNILLRPEANPGSTSQIYKLNHPKSCTPAQFLVTDSTLSILQQTSIQKNTFISNTTTTTTNVKIATKYNLSFLFIPVLEKYDTFVDVAASLEGREDDLEALLDGLEPAYVNNCLDNIADAKGIDY